MKPRSYIGRKAGQSADWLVPSHWRFRFRAEGGRITRTATAEEHEAFEGHARQASQPTLLGQVESQARVRAAEEEATAAAAAKAKAAADEAVAAGDAANEAKAKAKTKVKPQEPEPLSFAEPVPEPAPEPKARGGLFSKTKR